MTRTSDSNVDFQPTVTRRKAIYAGITTAASAASALIAPQVAQASSHDVFPRLDLFGVIETVIGNVVRVRSDGRKVVTVGPDTVVWRGRATTIDTFRKGDEVAVEGAWIGDTLHASYFGSAYRYLRGRVDSRREQMLIIDGAAAQIDRDTVAADLVGCFAKPLDEITAGDAIIAVGRWDARARSTVLLHVGVVLT